MSLATTADLSKAFWDVADIDKLLKDYEACGSLAA
jgi:hypothetical protein